MRDWRRFAGEKTSEDDGMEAIAGGFLGISPRAGIYRGSYMSAHIFSSPEPKAQGELIVWDSSRACVGPCVHTFKHEYL